jgi:hypothetical protein
VVQRYPRPGKLLQAWYPTVLDTGPQAPFRRWLTSTPDDLGNVDMLPTVVIGRYGGAPRVATLDDCSVDINVYCTGPDPMRAEDIALKRAGEIQWATEQWLVGTLLAYEDPDDGEIEQASASRLKTIASPMIRPYDSRYQIKKAHYAFQVRLHAVI